MSRIALITGAAGGLGQAVARQLEQKGWQLAVVSRDPARLAAAYGDRHLQLVGDCSTAAGVAAIFAALAAHQMLPVALAHCVGNIRLGALHRMRAEDFDQCLLANLHSAFHTLAGFTGALRTANVSGSAVFVSSAAARIGTPNHEAVAAAKAGVEGLVRAAAATYAPHGLRVNAVAPGILDTPAAAALLSSDVSRAAAARQYPLSGIGDPAELASLIEWLLSPAAARVTGQVWECDGGFASIRPLVK